jgi:hypothetical protein
MKKIRNLILILCLFVIGLQSVNAQNYAGEWEGKLTVVADGKDVELPFRMSIVTDGKGNCEGRTGLAIKIDYKDYAAIYKFKGTYNESSLTFDDYEIGENTTPPASVDFYWCKKSGTLYLSGKTLTGNVNGYSPRGRCMPAKCDIKKVE